MTIQATYHSEVRFVRSSYSSKTGTTITLALPDSDELSKVQGMDGKRYMLALVEIGDDEQPVQKPEKAEKPKGGFCSIWLARRCRDIHFQHWLRRVYDKAMGGDGTGWGDVTPAKDFGKDVEAYAAHCVKVLCDCESSRAEIDNDPRKAELFHSKIRIPYMKHCAITGVATLEEVAA